MRTVLFRAALELPLLHAGTWCAAELVRLGLVQQLPRHARWLRRLSERFARFGTDVGGMVVELAGLDTAGRPLRLRWWLEAAAGHGPEMPALVAVVLARELAEGRLQRVGAMPCVGLVSLEQLKAAMVGFRVRTGLDVLD